MSGTIDSVVANIEKLYSSSDPVEIAQIQSGLQVLQKSKDGYQLAKVLMTMDSKNCQFFGALTYSVVINTSKQLDRPSLELLLNDILGSIVSLLRAPDFSSNLFIIRKLVYDVALMFANNSEAFNNPIERFLAAVGLEPDLRAVVNTLEPRVFTTALNIASILVEELMKRESASQIHDVVFHHVYNNLVIMYEYLNTISVPFEIDAQALDCLNSWITYISMAETQSTVRYRDPGTLLSFLFKHFESTDFDDNTLELTNKAITATAEILEINPQMLSGDTKKFLQALLFEQGKWGVNYIDNVILNDTISEEEDVGNYVNLVLAFLSSDIISFSKNLNSPLNEYIVEIILKLTDFPSTPVIEEKVSEQFLTFWEELANIYIDDEETYDQIFEMADPSIKVEFFRRRDEIFRKVCSIYWSKVKIPIEDFQANRSEFLYYRSNVGDFFCTMYSLLKLPFYDKLTEELINQINRISEDPSNILDVESTLYILQKINDDCTFYESQSSVLLPYIDKVFDANLLTVLRLEDQTSPHYSIIYSTTISFIASIEFYLKTDRGSQYLNVVFNMLFEVILGTNLKLSLVASKTILSICQECRNNLTSFLPDLESLLSQMIRSDKIDNLIRQRMCNAYVSIAQTVPDPDNLAQVIQTLLIVIEEAASNLMLQQLDETQEDYLVSLLICVSEIGKASALPDEVDTLYTESQKNAIESYWSTDQRELKTMLLNIIRQFSLNFPPLVNNTTVTETCCQILKAGLNEPIKGPFSFSLQTIFEYLVVKIQNCNAPSVTHIYRLFETIVVTNYQTLTDSAIGEAVSKLFTERLAFLNSDPDMIQSSIELFATILEKRPSLIVNLPVFKDVVVKFAIDGLKAHETLIIKSTSNFWISLLSMKRGSREDQEHIRQLMLNDNFGLNFCISLVESFFNSTRSALGYYYPIFRNLISKYSLYIRDWLLVAFQSVQSFNVNDKETIIRQLLVTRGQRSANNILKKLWLQVNGLTDY